MRNIRNTLLALAVAVALPSALMAQVPEKAGTTKPAVKPATKTPTAKPKAETQEALAKEAKVSADAATATALKAVPGSTVKSHELEREKGKLIYSFDMKIAGKSGIEEVNIDAMTGEVIAKAHEADAPPKKAPIKKTGG